jgi:carboxyl-terminal processing protease
LKWDKINQSPFQPWESTFSTETIVSEANASVSASPNFQKIKTTINWLEKNNDRVYSLNLQKFKADQKELKDAFKNIETAYKLGTPFNIQNMAVDTAAINAATEKVERNKQWLKVRSEDIFIDQTVKVLNSMIRQTNMAKKN